MILNLESYVPSFRGIHDHLNFRWSIQCRAFIITLPLGKMDWYWYLAGHRVVPMNRRGVVHNVLQPQQGREDLLASVDYSELPVVKFTHPSWILLRMFHHRSPGGVLHDVLDPVKGIQFKHFSTTRKKNVILTLYLPLQQALACWNLISAHSHLW